MLKVPVNCHSTCVGGSWECTTQECATLCAADMFWNDCADCARTCSNMHVTCPEASCKTQVRKRREGILLIPSQIC